jgi:arylsulfatase A-like enzyme
MSQPGPDQALPRKPLNLSPMATGLVVGMGWGIIAALLDGLPLLLRGSPWPYLGSRLLALALVAAIFGTLGGIAGLALGGLTTLALRLTRRSMPGSVLVGAYNGILAAGALLIFLAHRFSPDAAGWAVILAFSVLVGTGVGWLASRAAGAGVPSWSSVGALVLATYLACFLVVLSVAGFRLLLRDLPLFTPRLTEERASADLPNLVLITAGGLRPDHLGAYGYDPAISPNIDALAQGGVRFEQVVAQSSWAGASLASLFTSLYPTELGVSCRPGISCQPHLDSHRTTLAESLRQAGYGTYAYVTGQGLTAQLGFDQGFDRFEAPRSPEPFDLRNMRVRAIGWLLGCDRDSAACHLLSDLHARLLDEPMPSGYGGDEALARVARFLERRAGERFFLWVHLADALPPYDSEPPFRPLPVGPLASTQDRLADIGFWELGDPFTKREKLLPEDAQGLVALYDGEVHRVDGLVGEVMQLLEAQGLTGRTLVVLTADHGQEFAEHGAYTYGHTLHEEVLRVPLIVAGPGIESPGQVVSVPVALLDLAPTLTEMAGTTLPSGAGGWSLVPALRGKPLTPRAAFSEGLMRVPHEDKAIRMDGNKLIYHLDEDRFELYDLTADPLEMVDIATQASELGDVLKRELLAWIDRTGEASQELPRATPPTEFRGAVW